MCFLVNWQLFGDNVKFFQRKRPSNATGYYQHEKVSSVSYRLLIYFTFAQPNLWKKVLITILDDNSNNSKRFAKSRELFIQVRTVFLFPPQIDS